MKTELVKISQVKSNPKNPRLIKGNKFRKLVKSIKEFPEMLKLRPIVVDDSNIVLGGNMRLKACIDAGLKEVYIIKASELNEAQQKEFIIKDNVNFGEWDYDLLGNEWELDELDDWGLELAQSVADQAELNEINETYDNDNCDYPIVAEFDEKHTAFVIFTSNAIEEAFVRTLFDKDKEKSFKNTAKGMSNVITFEELQKAVYENSNSKS